MAKKLLSIIILLLLTLAGLRLLLSSPPPEKPKTFVPRLVQKKVSYLPPPLSLESILDPSDLSSSRIATLSAEKVTVLVATGDVGLVRSVNFQMTQRNDFTYPFAETAAVLKGADLTLVNLEGPLVKNCPLTNAGMIFCGNSHGVEGLISAGVDLANLANNHALDYGQKGLTETVATLTKNKITLVGPEKIVVQNVKARKIAFLGYEDVNHRVDEKKIKAQIQEAGSLANLVVVSLHWGTEYTPYPNKRQQELARLAIDSGADLIIGNHPHWIQPAEIYQGKLIVYAHGNFIFDQMWSRKTREGIIGQYTFYEDQLIDAEFFPVLIDNTYQPHLLENKEKEALLKDFRQRSYNLSSR